MIQLLLIALLLVPSLVCAGQGMGPGPGIYRVSVSALSVSDNFNRADGVLGSSWETYSAAGPYSAPHIVGNAVVSSVTDDAATWSVAPGPNQYAMVDTVSCGNWCGVMLRVNPAAYTCYLGTLTQNKDGDMSYSLSLEKVVNGVQTALHAPIDVTIWGGGYCTDGNGGESDQFTCEANGGYWTVPTSNDIQKIRMNASGTTISLDTFNGTTWTNSRISATDSSISSGRIGLRDSWSTIDNFQGGDL